MPRGDVRERFLAKVYMNMDEPDSCWEWQASRDVHGYGYFRFGSETKAQRAAWLIEHGSIPLGMCVLHHCDNPPCVRLDHLFLAVREVMLTKAERATMPDLAFSVRGGPYGR